MLARLLVVFMLSSAAVNADDHRSEKFAKQSGRDVQIPLQLVSHIEKSYHAYLNSMGVVEPEKQAIKRSLMNVAVELNQQRKGALIEDTRILTPLGGGVIDLADFITPIRGSFDLKVEVEREDKVATPPSKVFFISRAKVRSIDGQMFGSGCGKWMDITRYFNRAMTGRGLALYTAAQRYLSVIGGTFLLVTFDKAALHVGSVTFVDNRFSDFLCESK